MTVVTVSYAKTNLSKLLVRVADVAEVVIARGKTPVARLTPIETATPGRAKAGVWKGRVGLDDSFFDPLPDDELALWNGEGGEALVVTRRP